MKRRVVHPLVPGAGIVFAAVLQTAAQSSTSLDQTLRAAVDRGDIAGVVVLATDRRGVIYQAAFGERNAAHAPMSGDTIFRIASMTKPVTSVALMQLVEQHQVALDDPADKYVPAFRDLKVFDSFDSRTGAYTLRAARRAPTVRELLTHTSGLAYPFVSPTMRDFKPRDGEKYEAGPLLFDPGTRWHYGPSTLWVGKIVEAVSHQTLEDYFQQHILRPLGMPDTSFNVPREKQRRVATVRLRQANGSLVERPQGELPVVTDYRGDGGLYSTARDYMRFARMIADGGALDGQRLLSADTVRLMAENHIGSLPVLALKTAIPEQSRDFTIVDERSDRWGLGFLIRGRTVPGMRSPGSLSWGGIDNTYFWIDRQRGIAGVVLMQMLPFTDEKALAVADAFERGVYQLAGK
jgi:CubicO group peptidase (beta-lactamase class C family)